MYRIKKIMITLLFVVSLLLFSLILFGNRYQRGYFTKEELEGYASPIVFLKSVENDKKYFIVLDNPDKKYFLEYSKIWDFDPANRTFLFSMMVNGEERIYEYDLQNENYQCLIDKSYISQYVQISNEEEFKSIYYHISSDEISGVYGNILFIYDVVNSKCIYTMQLPDISWREVYGWLNANTFLLRDFDKTFTFNIETGEMIETRNYLGTSIYISADKTAGSSARSEDWFGVSFTPILFWDTVDYKIKRFHEGINTSAHLQISDDCKYILFARGYANEDDQLLSIRIEDEKLCIFFETEDKIIDFLW